MNAPSPMTPAVSAPGGDKAETELSPSVSLEVVIGQMGGWRQASRGTRVCVNAPSLPSLPVPAAAASAMEGKSREL